MVGWKCLSKSSLYEIWTSPEKVGEREVREYRSNNKSLKYLAPEGGGDVVEDIYEGGHQLWQGTLVAVSHFAVFVDHFKPKRILDLGCGNGFLGIFFLKYTDVEKVVFQDLNGEVLSGATIKNLELNGIDSSRYETVSGFWHECFEGFEENSFDLILTSDTVYRIKNYDHLHNVFEKYLTKEGQVFVCGKDFYFGNDGGMLQFSEYISTKATFTKEIALRDEGNVTHTLLELRRS